MAEPIVFFAVQKLSDLLIDKSIFVFGVSNQVEQMKTELKRMQCFLKDADARQDESERVRNWVEEVREIAYGIDDVIETFTLKVASRRRRGVQYVIKRYTCIINEVIALYKVGLEIDAIINKITSLTTSLESYGIKAIEEGGRNTFLVHENQRLLRRSYSHVVEEDFVGMEEDVNKLVEILVDKYDSCRFNVSICGMGGLGKTTLAQKVYNHYVVRHHFDGFAWICISQEWQTKDVLQGILIKLVPEKRGQIMSLRDEELMKLLYDVQQKKKCLVVVDDIWSREAWDNLRHGFPSKKMGSKSKILLTTRNRDVALHVDPSGFLHEPRCLSEEESWELFQKKAFPRRNNTDFKVDGNMEKLGKEMVGRCGGLPLAIVVLGGVLVTKHTYYEWKMVHENIQSYLRRGKGHGQQHEGVPDILALSYHDLPCQLKACFSYLANFPEDSEIPAQKLYELWVAEGIISSDEGDEEETMTDVAERCLGELAQRYMVRVHIKESTGRFKSCYLHDLMRDLCLSKVKEVNFLKIIDFRHGVNLNLMDTSLLMASNATSSSKVRRLAIYLDQNVDEFLPPGLDTNQPLRSILFYHARKCNKSRITRPEIKLILNNFKLLRVLDLEDCHFGEVLPNAIGNLTNLRYMNLRNTCFKKYPSSMGKLIHLQTLDLRVESNGYITIPDVLWKLKQLRHLYLPSKGKDYTVRLDGLNKLEKLRNFSTKSCSIGQLFRLTNLRELAVSFLQGHEELVQIVHNFMSTSNRLRHSSFRICCDFSSRQELDVLRELFGFHHLCKLDIEGLICKLPPYNSFSPNLAKLTLKGCELKEDPMATLEKLPNLQKLSLCWGAFVGEIMICHGMGFPRLKFLELWHLPYLKYWKVFQGAMPSLLHLRIGRCQRLLKVPSGLRDVTSLQELEIRGMPEEFEKRVRVVDGKEGKDFYKVRHVPSIKFSLFD